MQLSTTGLSPLLWWQMLFQFFVSHRSPVFCATWAANTINYTVEQLEGPCFLKVATSREKLSLLTSSKEVHDRVTQLCPRISESGVQPARNLGVAFALNGTPSQSLFRKRFAEAKNRTRRLTKVRKAGIKVKTCVQLVAKRAAMYGTAVMGHPPSSSSMLAKLRSMFHSTIHKHASSRSCTVDFALDGKFSDPTYSAIRDPVMHF